MIDDVLEWIVSGNEGDWFYIDRTHGFVYNKVVLDREQRSFYDLLVKATNDPQYSQVILPRNIYSVVSIPV